LGFRAPFRGRVPDKRGEDALLGHGALESAPHLGHDRDVRFAVTLEPRQVRVDARVAVLRPVQLEDAVRESGARRPTDLRRDLLRGRHRVGVEHELEGPVPREAMRLGVDALGQKERGSAGPEEVGVVRGAVAHGTDDERVPGVAAPQDLRQARVHVRIATHAPGPLEGEVPRGDPEAPLEARPHGAPEVLKEILAGEQSVDLTHRHAPTKTETRREHDDGQWQCAHNRR